MNERVSLDLDLEVTEIERKLRGGCGNSSSTHPRCTCIPEVIPENRS
jgi:hypothetical protein